MSAKSVLGFWQRSVVVRFYSVAQGGMTEVTGALVEIGGTYFGVQSIGGKYHTFNYNEVSTVKPA